MIIGQRQWTLVQNGTYCFRDSVLKKCIRSQQDVSVG